MSTPQNLALRDAVRGLDLFKKVNVPILGMVQNMSTFHCSECGHKHDIFGLDGAFHDRVSDAVFNWSSHNRQEQDENVMRWG